ncbi:MAG: FGGY family carbohydrate kinase [Candidatus Limnocylindrales bacterium]
MATRVVLAFDVGTSGVKATLVDARAGIIGSAGRGYGLSTPAPGWVDQDGLAIRAAMARASRELLRDRPVSVEAVSVTAQMFSLQPVDAALEPVGPMLSWLDQRAAGVAADLARRVPPEEQARRLGSRVTAKDIVARALWLRAEAPDRYARTAWLLDCKEAVVAWLCGVAVIDPSGASAWRLTDATGEAWQQGSCTLAGIDRALLPPIAPATTIAGGLTAVAARALGVPAGTPVLVGAGDVPASQLGAGAVGPGRAHLSLGTAAYLGIDADPGVRDPAGNLGTLAHAVPGRTIVWLEIATGGGALAWVGRVLAPAGARGMPPARLERLASSVAGETDDLLFAPWLSGERVPLFDDSARGAFVGLGLQHGPGHLARAVMEGVAFQIRWALAYGIDFGTIPTGIRVVGGGGVGSVWLGIIADTLDRELEVVASPQDAAALGAAAIAFVGLGWWDGLQRVDDLVRVERVVRPDPARTEARDRLYPLFQRLHPALAAASADPPVEAVA